MAPRKKKIILPEGYDPYDVKLKKLFDEKADALTYIHKVGVKQYLACGAKRKGNTCKQPAGRGTSHIGQGRCKNHGGCNTGPKAPEAKAITAQNAKKHGFYAAALAPEERKVYEELQETKALGLEHEIYALKAKILTYLTKWRGKWDQANEKSGAQQADIDTRVWFSTGEAGQGTRSYYHAGTIEDRALDRALNTVSRLVEKHARLTQVSGDDLLSKINAELKEASYGKVQVSWGGSAQARTSEGGGLDG